MTTKTRLEAIGKQVQKQALAGRIPVAEEPPCGEVRWLLASDEGRQLLGDLATFVIPASADPHDPRLADLASANPNRRDEMARVLARLDELASAPEQKEAVAQ